MTPADHPARIGIFGGAFDPPHVAHRMLVQTALDQLQLDQLRVFPTGQAWHRSKPVSDAAHRIAMAQLAFGGMPRVVVDSRETLRPGPTYTVDTLRELTAEQPRAQWFLVIGQDQAEALRSWRDWEVVVQLAIICVASRLDSTGVPAHFSPPSGLEQRFRLLDIPNSPVSATEIRRRVASHEAIVPMVGDTVARYIVHHNLYQPA